MGAGTVVRPNGAEGPRFWDQLLLLIEEGRVVPVVGQDLLTIEIDGRPTLLYPWLARRLAEYLKVSAEDLPQVNPFHEVACRLLAEDGELDEVYSGLKTVLPRPGQLAIPEPLLQLARIRPFKLFVSTTFDPLLARAIDEARFGGQPKTQVFDYSLDELQDLGQPLDAMDRPAVFHLFGQISARPAFAVTEEDLLEFFHALQSESRRPDLLLDELANRQVLLIGNGFPDWLTRFFLRISRRERLWQARGRHDVVADGQMSDDPELVAFLQRFSSRTRLFSGGAVEFVAELSRRWEERHPPDTPVADPPPGDPLDPLQMVKGAVFLSYASEDRAVVDALRQELESAGIDVWFDREQLEPGDDYEARIRRNIESCSLFVPILSRHTLTARRRYFRMEWAWAERVSLQVAPGQRFIVPVILDDLPADDPALPEVFRRLQAQRIGAGGSHPELVTALTRYYRDYQLMIQAAPA